MRYPNLKMLKKSLVILSVMMLTANVVFAQAIIDTSNVENIIYVNVDHINASDDNTGLSPDEPIKTLQKAIDLCKDIRSKIVIYPGHYRSYLDILSNQLLILEAKEPGTVYITGSDVFTDWTLTDSVYTHQWDYNWGYFDDSNFCFGPCLMSDYQKRRELVFIDSVPVKQVVNKNHLAPNTFFVDEPNNRLILYPDDAVNMQTAMVEVATRGYNIYNEGRNGSLVKATVLNEAGLIIRGIVFQHVANTAHQDALTISYTTNVIIEDCIFQWNNGVGIEFERCSNITVNECILRYNGERGMGVVAGLNVRISGIKIYENNWRTNAQKIIAHDAAGIKIIGGTENCILEDIHAYNNYCHVIWFDWNNGNYEIRNSLIEHNQEAGIMLEASRKPASVYNTKLLYNRIGILGYGHANVSVDSCFLFANGSQISLGQDGRTVSQDNNWEINSNDWNIKNSKIIAASPTQGMLSFFQYLSPSTRASNNYFNTAEADSNTYFHPNGDKQWPNGQSVNGGQLRLDEWRNITGQDINSVWEKPSPDDVGGNEPPVAILEYEFFNDSIVRFFADKSYDPEGLINSYKWYFGDGNTSENKNINHFYRITGNVEVSLVVTDFFNVKDSVSISLFIGPNNIREQLSSKPSAHIYPNPVKENFFIKLSPEYKSNKGKIIIFNTMGQIVFEHDFLNTDTTLGPFSATHLNTGIYFVTIYDNNGEKTTQKLIRNE
jgi:parallel beta-helix repeat protein